MVSPAEKEGQDRFNNSEFLTEEENGRGTGRSDEQNDQDVLIRRQPRPRRLQPGAENEIRN